MIELKGVSKYYHTGETTSMGLHNINVTMNEGEIIAIVGESGSGKSTLLNVITKLDTFDEGEIYYKGNETSYFSIADMDDFRKNKIGFIFQNSNIIDSYTVLENVMLPLTLKGIKNKDAKKRALELIEKVGLTHRIHSRGTKLSGGEKQRCVIARALASDCEILACDEPTGNLDSKTGSEIISLIKEVAKDKLVLIVTHNFDQVKDIVTRKIRIDDGQIVEDETYVSGFENEDKDLDLDYKPLSKSVCLKVAKNNVLFTPKKTILLSFIFLAICLASLFMFQSIYTSDSSVEYNKIYKNNLSNRVLVYRNDNEELDMNKFKGLSYDKNSFYEDIEVSLCTYYSTFIYNSYAFNYSDRYSYTLKDGRMPENNNEIVIINPTGTYNSTGYLLFGEKLGIRDFTNSEFTVVGYGYSDEVSGSVITGNKYLREIMKKKLIIDNSYGFSKVYTSYVLDENADKIEIHYYPGMVPELAQKITSFNCGYDFTSVCKFVEDSSVDSNSIVVHMNGNTMEDEPVYEASVYGNITYIKMVVGDSGYSFDQCSKLSYSSAATILINNILKYVSILFSSFGLVVVFFLTYVILARVYASKKKDYEILRTLGVTQKDMKHIVNYEVLSIGVFVSIISYIAFIIMVNNIPLLKTMNHLSWVVSIYYFVITIFFTYSIARRFNKKLFKFSVSKSLKGGELHA